jgi:RNA polymerase sigma-70 factor (ECF subfamily)
LSSPLDQGRDETGEEEWVWRLRKGEAEALNHFARVHWSGLVRFGHDLLGSTDAAKDVVQEALIRLWERRREFEGRGSIRNYLLQTVRRLALNELRGRRVRERPEVEARVREIRPSPVQPDAELEGGGLEAAIEAALKKLPERRREALVLVRFQGLSYREAAELMELSAQTVANHVCMALKDLRKELAGYADA